ncbi:hypothetical protein CEV34_0235 [Brucella pseudogrignonensis]|uniref:Uncharacterized protein n=1 Tax=Brucella pseudogrignonensis TaxID=419475 RepID=A0A256GV22_9HYPH|nr:hypothetical protein CEV34_0235 [Brucella pseudogrignonensis]
MTKAPHENAGLLLLSWGVSRQTLRAAFTVKPVNWLSYGSALLHSCRFLGFRAKLLL